MNFCPNIPNNFGGEVIMNNPMMGSPVMNNQMVNNDLFYRISEMENRIKKLEQRIARLENDNGNNINYSEPDNSLYMI